MRYKIYTRVHVINRLIYEFYLFINLFSTDKIANVRKNGEDRTVTVRIIRSMRVPRRYCTDGSTNEGTFNLT